MEADASVSQPGVDETPEAPAAWSHYPALPPPVRLPLATLPAHPCPYLPNRMAEDRGVWAPSVRPALYQQFMDAGFRRSGKLLYQPACRGCRACLSIRVPVAEFRPDKSQRRCARRNADLRITHAPPALSQEKLSLYEKYVRLWHGREEPNAVEGLESFLYESPLATTMESEYRDPAGRLLAVGICDLCPSVLSSVYLFFDPDEARRGLGTFAVLSEIAFAAERKLAYYYLGYWVQQCRAMEYKANFRPNQVLQPDGVWRKSSN